ncbi:hypothetical protein IIU_05740 [Bacillus cereus VD133]|uniref:Phage capsid-like C-terminal domain-containing protein n=1 Tax=Bacillus cereus VD133 TaxID=1053233 RepID=A0A9W5PLK3_BACCE|nr:phage major capsid protein [Bacillus cereus]EOO28622.1 hypothetical protein IIU_05740 [Bacillus cereus VD133]
MKHKTVAFYTKQAPRLPLKIGNFQFFSDSTLFDLKQNMATIGQQLQKVENDLSQKAIDPTVKMDDIRALQTSKTDLQMRFNVIKEQHDALEAEQRAKLAAKKGVQTIEDPKQRMIQAKAELIRATIMKSPVKADILQALGDDPSTGGGKFLPKTVATDILSEPLVKNPLRELSTFTQITNLEVPKIDFTLDDDDFIADKETAKELKSTGSTVEFGRNKFKVFAGVSETVLNGTETNLVMHVERTLQSGVASKEKKVSFATSPKKGEEHMSFYASGMKEISGENLYKAIKAAIADLHEDYRENAKIVMRYQDYSTIIETLANGQATLYTAQPEQILGKPVIFCDAAISPIVGDFSYSHFNYDLNSLYETDKDIKTGVQAFVVTAWFDHQIKLKSAFRIAKVMKP